MKKLFVISFFVFLMIALASCGTKNVTLDMDMNEYKFIPDTLTVPAGSEVIINLSNSGTLEHEMVVMVLGAEATIPFDADDIPNVYWEHELEQGSEETVTFTAPSEPGEYQIVCGIPAHLEQGMVGKLIVE